MSLLYPVADTAEAALHAPRGYAAREREAELLAASPVHFVTEAVGPAFASLETALQAFPDADGAGWKRLAPAIGPQGAPPPSRPVFRDGRRWPEPPAPSPELWRLCVSYWRVGRAVLTDVGDASPVPADPARTLRRREGGRRLEGAALHALSRQPLRPVKPQQPLDIGLFEMRRPEAPGTLIPDE